MYIAEVTRCACVADVQHVQDVPGDDITYQALTWAGTHPYLYVGGQSMVIHACQLIR